MASHTYSSIVAVPGGSAGQLISVTKSFICWSGQASSGWSHACDLTTGARTRFSTNEAPYNSGNASYPEVACYDSSRGRIWATGRNSRVSYLDLATGAHTLAYSGGPTGYNATCARVPYNDIMICWGGYYAGSGAGTGPLSLSLLSLSTPSSGFYHPSLVGDTLPVGGDQAVGFDWDTDRNLGYLFLGNWTTGAIYGYNDLNHVWKITPPATSPLTNAWTVTRITLPSSLPTNNSDGVYSRWRYCSTIKKFAYVSRTTDLVTLWTPPA